MKITVNDCLNLEAFSECMVVAGVRQTHRRIRSVSVMDATDPAVAIANNGVREQLVLTSFFGVPEKRAQIQVLRGLAEKEISGLVVFHVGEDFVRTHGSLLEAAEELSLPLILIPQGKGRYAEAIEQVMDKMLYGENFRNGLINNTIFHLLNFERHPNFQVALKEAALSNDFQVVLLSKDFNPILTVETRYRVSVADTVRTLKQRNEATSSAYAMVDVDGILAYWGDISIHGETYFLLIVDNDDNYSASEMTKLAEIIELAMGMWKYTPERDVKAEFIKALMRGNTSLAYSAKDEVGIDPERIVSAFYAKGIDCSPCLNRISEFEKTERMDVYLIHENGESYGLVLQGEDFDPERSETPKACALALFDELKELTKFVRVFHTTGIDGITGAADGFRLIGETWTFVESVFPYKRVFSKYEMTMVSGCIAIQVQGGYLKRNYADLLTSFNKEMGVNKARQLLETLETFVLDSGMNSSKTAEFMGIHTNTVQYRLRRINEVLGAEITGNRVIPGLTIALALTRLERVIK